MKSTKKLWLSEFPLLIVILIILNSCEKKDKVYVPEIVTFEVTNITQTSATSGGEISNNVTPPILFAHLQSIVPEQHMVMNCHLQQVLLMQTEMFTLQ